MAKLEIGAGYVRVSSDDQTELSPDAQIREIRQAAKADGYTIPPEFIFIEKKGISGRKADNRPEFQRMIAIAKSQSPAPFSRLYVWKFSRFARNQEESIFYKGILRKKCNVDIKSVSEPLVDGMFGRLIETIIEWFDEYYSYNLSGEVIRGMTEKALRKGYQTCPSLGYKAVGEGQPFVIDPEAYRLVEYMFRAYLDGKDMTAIAREINRWGYKTRRGCPFERRTVERVLQNRFYVGEVTWRGITFQGPHETRESVTAIFDAVQERIKSQHKSARRRDASANAHWLSGLLKCGICGASLGFNRTSNPHKRPDFFNCWRYTKGAHAGSCSVSVRIAEQAVLDSLRRASAGEDLDYEYIPRRDVETVSQETVLREALARMDVKEKRIREAYEGGVDTLEEYKANKARLAAERAEIRSDLARLAASEGATKKAPDKAEVMRRIQDAYALVSDPDVSNEDKGNALRSVLTKIVFDRKEGRFSFFYYVS